jgi:hypothetical protein
MLNVFMLPPNQIRVNECSLVTASAATLKAAARRMFGVRHLD